MKTGWLKGEKGENWVVKTGWLKGDLSLVKGLEVKALNRKSESASVHNNRTLYLGEG